MTLSSRVESGFMEDRPSSVAKLIAVVTPQALRTYIGMSERWEVVSATQITRSGAATTGTLASQFADHWAVLCALGGDQRQSLGVTRRRSGVKPYADSGAAS
jgi:hypothetical protein